MRLMNRSLRALGFSALLAGCTDGATLPRAAPPEQAHFDVVGADVTGDEVLLHFEGLPDRWWVPVGWHYMELGVYIGNLAPRVMGAPGGVDETIWFRELAPPVSGSTLLSMGYNWWSAGSPPSLADILFFDPVAEISMIVTPEHDFAITCYDRDNRVVGRDYAEGALTGGGFPSPFPRHEVKVAGPGIIHCVLEIRGGSIDDIRFRRSGAKLVVTCVGDLGENRVTRGEEVTCTPSTEPEGGEIQFETWSFEGTDSRGQPYCFPESEMDGPIRDPVWDGKMAIGGTVRLRARIDGGEVKDTSVAVTVVPRNWENVPVDASVSKVSYEEYTAVTEPPPSYPRNVSDLGRTHRRWFPVDLTANVIEQIDDYGPNHYLVYFTAIPARLEVRVLLHPEMERQGDFWKRQASRQPDFSPRPVCVRGEWERYAEQILAHEGYPPSPQSHSGIFIAEFARLVGPEVESLVYPDNAVAELAAKSLERMEPLGDRAAAISGQPVDDRYGIPFGCEFFYGNGNR